MADENTTKDEEINETTEAPAEEANPATDGLTELKEQVAALAEVANSIAEGVEALRSSMAGFVEAGATIREAPEDEKPEVPTDESEEVSEIDLETPIEDLDFDLDDED